MLIGWSADQLVAYQLVIWLVNWLLVGQTVNHYVLKGIMTRKNHFIG
jgi:hypothetical protein